MLDLDVLYLVVAVELLIHILLLWRLVFLLAAETVRSLLALGLASAFLSLPFLRFPGGPLPDQWRAVVHHYLADQMRALQSYVQVYLVVQGDVGQDR